MRTKLAKEPRDVYWKSILIPGRMKIIRVIVAYLILLFIAVFWVGPIALLSLLTSPQTLVKIAPGLVNNQNPIVQAIFQGILPPLAVNIFMALMPLILDGKWRRLFVSVKAHSFLIEYILSCMQPLVNFKESHLEVI
jgi:hypothetical protein